MYNPHFVTRLNDTPLLSDANLQFYMLFEDSWADNGPNGYTLTPSGSPTFVNGKFGKAGNFVAASSQKATRAISSMANVAITTTQSWLFWINNPTFVANNYHFGISNGSNWFVYTSGAGHTQWAHGLSVGHDVALPAANEFHHVCFTYNSSTSKISSFLDFLPVQDQVSVTGTFSKSGATFGLGNIGDYAGYGTFIIDELAMFNREITAIDLAKLNTPYTQRFFAQQALQRASYF